ncbi:MAG: class I SAM-dependent methyltransferase [Alphaproteobacteria bacterium]|nr:class I SAM-dependent methyltransferase [Alphaproteobacteria bacterium]
MQKYIEANRRWWNEATGIHLENRTGFYGTERFRAGADILGPIESREIGDVSGQSLIHLQCHFGLDTLSLARRGADVVGVDFSAAAISAARALSEETGVAGEFIESDLYAAPSHPDLQERQFDRAYVTWGAINWLPDIAGWAEVVGYFLKPGGRLYLLETHPAAMMLEEDAEGALAPTYPYFQSAEPLLFDAGKTYTGDDRVMKNSKSYEWNHPLSSIFSGLRAAGMSVEWLHEFDALPYRLFPSLREKGEGMYTLPDGAPTIPLSFSISAIKQ